MDVVSYSDVTASLSMRSLRLHGTDQKWSFFKIIHFHDHVNSQKWQNCINLKMVMYFDAKLDSL